MMENGFLISIMVTVLLAGLTFYFVKRELGKTERKLTSMFQLIQSITTELNKINDILVKENDSQVNDNNCNEEVTCCDSSNLVCSLEKCDEQLSSSEEHDVSKEIIEPEVEEVHTIQIAAISLSDVEALPEDTKIIELTSENDNDTDTDSSEESELDTESDEENIELEVVKRDNNEDNRIEVTSDSSDSNSIKKDSEHKTLNIVDYSKLHVGPLRKIVEEKGLITDAKKLKKKELLELLG